MLESQRAQFAIYRVQCPHLILTLIHNLVQLQTRLDMISILKHFTVRINQQAQVSIFPDRHYQFDIIN